MEDDAMHACPEGDDVERVTYTGPHVRLLVPGESTKLHTTA